MITVDPSISPARAPQLEAVRLSTYGSNPTAGQFAVASPAIPGATATLTVFDLSGRRVAVVEGPSGTPLAWEGTDETGRLVNPGIYVYRVEAGTLTKTGKVVIVR